MDNIKDIFGQPRQDLSQAEREWVEWDKLDEDITNELLATIKPLYDEYIRVWNDDNMGFWDRSDIQANMEDEIDAAIIEAKKVQEYRNKNKLTPPVPKAEEPDFVRERKEAREQDNLVQKVSNLEIDVEALREVVEILTENLNLVSEELREMKELRKEDNKKYTYLDYLSPEDRVKAEQVSKNNATKRNMFCPKCGIYIGKGSWRSHQDNITNHVCEVE